MPAHHKPVDIFRWSCARYAIWSHPTVHQSDMSLLRLVYYSAMISAWAAFLGWGVSEWITSAASLDPATTSHATGVFVRFVLTVVTAGTIGAAIGLGLNVLGGMANGQWRQLLRRALPGLLCGGAGGLAGGLVGGLMYYYDLPRAIGWAVFGLGVGCAEGVYDRSFRKIRNGLIGGAAGGFVGGMLFNWICDLKLTDSGAASRAAGFVVLGFSIGAAIGTGPRRLPDGLAHRGRRLSHRTAIDSRVPGDSARSRRPRAAAVFGADEQGPRRGTRPGPPHERRKLLPGRQPHPPGHAIERPGSGERDAADRRRHHSRRHEPRAFQPAASPAGRIAAARGRARRRHPFHTASPAPPPPPQSSADKVFAPEPRPWIGKK